MKLPRSITDFARETKGIASLEFVLILFPMMIIFFGMLQWGIMLYHYNEMENVARETVRRMAVDDDMQVHSEGTPVDCPGAANSAEALACSMLGVQSVGEVSACYEQVVVPPDDPVFKAVVTIQAPMDTIGLLDIFGIGAGENLTATANMRVEPDKISEGGFEPGNLCPGTLPVAPQWS